MGCRNGCRRPPVHLVALVALAALACEATPADEPPTTDAPAA